MKRYALYFLFFFSASFVVGRVCAYLEGYGAKLTTVIFWADIFSKPVFLVSLPALVFIWLRSLFKKKDRKFTSGALLAAVVLVTLVNVTCKNFSIEDGVKDRALHDNSLGDMRKFADEIAHLPESGNPGMRFNRTKIEDVQMRLQGTYPFLSWGRGASHVSIHGSSCDIVVVEWGGPPTGYWGLFIAPNGRKLELGDEDANASTVKVSDDIAAFYKSE